MDHAVFVDFVMAFLAAVLPSLALLLVKWLFDRLHIQATDQQRQAVYAAVSTASGLVLQSIRTQAISIADLHYRNANVQRAADYVMTNLPKATADLGMTPEGVSKMIVGAVSKELHTDPTVPVVMNPASPPVGPDIIVGVKGP